MDMLAPGLSAESAAGPRGEPPARDRTSLAHGRGIVRAIDMLDARLADPLSLDMLADAACMSPFHFSRVFRGFTGTPPGQFLSAKRLDRAKALLARTALSVTDVCFEVGYQSFGTFISRFHSLVGVTPTRFREAYARYGAMTLAMMRDCLRGECAPIVDESIDCEVVTPADFDGIIFVALFEGRFPAGAPRACRLVAAPGRFHLGFAANESRTVLSVGAAWSATLGDLLVGANRFPVARSIAADRLRLSLRPASVFDPPMLTAFPLLLVERMGEEGTIDSNFGGKAISKKSVAAPAFISAE